MFSPISGSKNNSISIESNDAPHTLNNDSVENIGNQQALIKKIHFYVYCPTCKALKQGRYLNKI